jgi:RNA polymerase sigma-70 factor (ECF subfamily)
VYAFLRRNGHDPHAAEDLTQGFFHFLLARDAFQSVAGEKGRFRSFLLAALNNYLHNERDRQQARKRGGGHHFISLDQVQAEEFYRHEPVTVDAGRDFDRSWAAMLVRGVLEQLRAEHEQRGRAALFAGLQAFLTGEPQARDYEQLARQLGMEPGTVKVALHRARRRFGELLRREVANTVSEPAEVEAEIRHLLATLAE